MSSIWLSIKTFLKKALFAVLGFKVSALYLAALVVALFWPRIARGSFQTDPFPGRSREAAAGLVLASFLSFIAFIYVAFTLNDPFLLWNIDGKRFVYLVQQQHVWLPSYLGYTNDFLHSMGNIWYPLSMKLDPGYALATDASGNLDRRLCYVIFSIELYLSAFLLAAVLRQGVVVASIAGWIIVLLAMPIAGLPAIYPVLAMAPNYPLTPTLLILCLFRGIGRGRDGYSALLALGIVLLLALVSIGHPTTTILMAPILLLFSAALLVAADSRREMIVKLVAGAAGCALLGVLGFPNFLRGIFEYSAPYYFSSELFDDRAFYYFVSIAFHKDAGFWLFVFAAIGALALARFGGRLERAFAIGLLAAMTLLIGGGASTVSFYRSWRGPSPIYFEFFLWPIYAVFAAATLRAVYFAGLALFRRAMDALPKLKARIGGVPVFQVVVVLLLLCAPWALLKQRNPQFARVENPLGLVKPLPKTQIVSLLEKEVGLRPGSLYTGRVATLTGQALDRPVNWHDMNGLDSDMFVHGGNSHQSIGLWMFGIPTLFELSSLISPPFFLVTREFLERPGDLQMRNAIVLRKFDARILRALGVRFVITDAPLDGGATLRLREEMPTSKTHYLYELKDVNQGGYSPTAVEVIADVGRTLAALGKPSFDFKRTAILEAPLETALVPARASEIHVEPGHLRLSAISDGTSLLVLPFEFSRCLTLERSGAGAESDVRLVRVNLLQAGIVFTRKLDATLTYFTGPFRNAGCRVDDRKDMDRLGIRQFHKEIALPPSRFPGLE